MSRRRRAVFSRLAVAGLLLAALSAALAGSGESGQEPLAGLGIAVTGGAAPGYVPDRVCRTCHAEIFRTYQDVAQPVGMARSFYRPRPEILVEDFAAPPLSHGPSRQLLQLVRRGDKLVFRRWQNGPDGQPVRLFEVEVDWILGSGNHARTYLYRTPDGALFQLPIAWYSQEWRWGMAPGYDRPDHSGVLRRVRRECLFCHNAYPDVPAGSDAEGAAHTFPAELPEGTGCQRCHGPGAEHVRRALGGIEPAPEIRAAIVNPARLAPERRDDVCFQCHLQPAVALSGARRLGRGDYSFRPGEALPDYQAHVDVTEETTPAGERFEINHHAYRLRQSRCFLASAGKLYCLTCHDPHRKIAEPERAAHYRAACQSCHAAEACKRSEHGGVGETGGVADQADCVSCHMPKRRPRDVVHVVMTDHLIRRRPGGPELLAPLAESEPVLTGVEVLEPARLPPAERDLYRTLPVARTGASPDAVDHLAKLAGRAPEDPALQLETALAELRLRRYADAERRLARLHERGPKTGRLLEALATAREGLGRDNEAEALLRQALTFPDIDRPETTARLGQLLVRRKRPQEAVELLTRAVAERPNLVGAWLRLGEAQAALGRKADAAASFRRALAIDPTATPVERALAGLGE